MKARVKMLAMLVAAALLFSACEEVVINPRDEGKTETKAQVSTIEPGGLKKLDHQK